MSASDVISYVRGLDQRFASVPDDEVLAYAVKADPRFAQELSTSEKAKINLDRTAREEGFAPGAGIKGQLANVIQAKGEEAQQQSDAQAYGQFGSTAVKAAAAGAAGLATGGVGLYPALAIMGGAGLGSSLAGTMIEEATGTHKSLKERAGEAALDTGLALAGEGIGRGIGLTLKKAIPEALMSASARSTKGAENLAVQQADLFANLTKSVQTAAKRAGQQHFWTDVSKPLETAVKELKKLPKGRGPLMGGKLTQLTDTTQEFLENAIGHLKMARMGGQIGDLQPLDAVVRAQMNLKEVIGGLNGVEKGIVERAYRGLDRIVKADLAGIPGAPEAYSGLQKIAEAQGKANMGTRFAEALTRRAVTGAAGAAVGGPVGAAVGVASGGMIPQAAAVLLERVAQSPKLAKTFRNAATLFSGGHIKSALAIGNQILKQSQMGDVLSYISSPPPGTE